MRGPTFSVREFFSIYIAGIFPFCFVYIINPDAFDNLKNFVGEFDNSIIFIAVLVPVFLAIGYLFNAVSYFVFSDLFGIFSFNIMPFEIPFIGNILKYMAIGKSRYENSVYCLFREKFCEECENCDECDAVHQRCSLEFIFDFVRSNHPDYYDRKLLNVHGLYIFLRSLSFSVPFVYFSFSVPHGKVFLHHILLVAVFFVVFVILWWITSMYVKWRCVAYVISYALLHNEQVAEGVHINKLKEAICKICCSQ